MSKKFTKKCFAENRTKLSFVKEYIENGDFVKAIKIVAKFHSIPKSLSIVKEVYEVLNNPRWAKLYFKDKSIEDVISESIQAIKIEYKF